MTERDRGTWHDAHAGHARHRTSAAVQPSARFNLVLVASSGNPSACPGAQLGSRKSLPTVTTMRIHPPTPRLRRLGPAFFGVLLAGILSILTPAASQAAVMNFGSPLSVSATRNTSEYLAYPGTNTPVPVSPDAPGGIFHTPHFGADTALWNAGVAGGDAVSPAAGQAIKVSLEGCAREAAGGPAPLTEIHFQDLSPLPGGGAHVKNTSQPFQIPVCGEHGVSGSTVTTYEPVKLCVSAGDYVGFNDDGGYVENIYRSGVPYEVIGGARGSTMNSFIKNDGTGDGALLSSSETSAMDGFASNRSEELMLRVTLGTGPDALHACAGGTRGLLAPIRVSPQTDGVNHQRMVAVAVFCRVAPVCNGVLTLSGPGTGPTYGRVVFAVPGDTTAHVPIRVSSQMIGLIRSHSAGVYARLNAFVAGKTVSQTIDVKIF